MACGGRRGVRLAEEWRDHRAQIPAHAEEDDLGLIVTPLEEIGFGHRQTSEEDSGSGQSAIVNTRHPFFATQPEPDIQQMRPPAKDAACDS